MNIYNLDGVGSGLIQEWEGGASTGKLLMKLLLVKAACLISALSNCRLAFVFIRLTACSK